MRHPETRENRRRPLECCRPQRFLCGAKYSDAQPAGAKRERPSAALQYSGLHRTWKRDTGARSPFGHSAVGTLVANCFRVRPIKHKSTRYEVLLGLHALGLHHGVCRLLYSAHFWIPSFRRGSILAWINYILNLLPKDSEGLRDIFFGPKMATLQEGISEQPLDKVSSYMAKAR